MNDELTKIDLALSEKGKISLIKCGWRLCKILVAIF